jgi:hypothetical protein
MNLPLCPISFEPVQIFWIKINSINQFFNKGE